MNIGKRLRRMREAQELTLEQVAAFTGLDEAYLEAVEGGRELPSIGSVVKLSRALGAQMGQLLHGAAGRSDLFSVCRAGTGRAAERGAKTASQGYSYESLLAPEIRGQGMEPFLVTFDPEAAPRVEPTTHEGEEFLYVLSGALELVYDGESRVLGAGDSLYFDSSRPHAVRAAGGEPARALAVVYARG